MTAPKIPDAIEELTAIGEALRRLELRAAPLAPVCDRAQAGAAALAIGREAIEKAQTAIAQAEQELELAWDVGL